MKKRFAIKVLWSFSRRRVVILLQFSRHTHHIGLHRDIHSCIGAWWQMVDDDDVMLAHSTFCVYSLLKVDK